ncbi:MAG: hypothetical protein RL142_245 [Actinomycetota bacterium]|jgi:uncharacterized protein
MTANNPYLIPVHDLMHKAGTMRRVHLDIQVPDALDNSVVTVEKGAEIVVDGRLESVHEGILVSANVSGDAKTECSRCLDPLKLEVDVEFQELFAYSLTDEDDLVITDETIDLEQVVRDAVVLSLPFNPLCSSDCLGLCVDCGVKLSENPQHEHEAPVDPRWNALKNLME